jgi:hypothetical protein
VAAAKNPGQEALVKPTVIGTPDAPEVEKKRGWWRR